MKSFNEMAERVITRRDKYVAGKRKEIKKLTAVISCFCLCTVIGIGAWQGGLFETRPTPGVNDGEIVPNENYFYEINEGPFCGYVGGKVIAQDKVGGKVADVTLTAGWRNAADSQWLSQETLRGEVYSIEGIENNVAVALKFVDKGEAVTTTHYYVIMNPNADLSAVEEYIISQWPTDNNNDIVAE